MPCATQEYPPCHIGCIGGDAWGRDCTTPDHGIDEVHLFAPTSKAAKHSQAEKNDLSSRAMLTLFFVGPRNGDGN